MNAQRRRGPGDPGPGGPRGTQGPGTAEQSPRVSPLTVPALFGGMMIGLFSGFLFGWWGLIGVGAVVLGTVSMVLAGRSRDVATALLLGTVSAYVIVILLAIFRRVI